MLWRRRATAVEGKDGFLFLANDTNRVLDQITGKRSVSRRTLDAIARAHRERMEAAEAIGAAYRHVIVPNKELVLARFLPDAFKLGARGPTPVQAYLAAGHAARYRSLFFDPDHLTERSREGEVFPRTDSHWTYLGAYHYLLRALEAIGRPEELAAMKALRGVVEFRTENVGDLGAKLGKPPESMPVVDLHAPWIELLVTNEIHNKGFVRHYRNPQARVRKRMLVIHDSTVNWLVKFITSIYEEALFIHSPDIDLDLLRAYRPAALWSFQIERFFVRPPRNDIDMVAYVRGFEKAKGAELSALPFLRGLKAA